MKPIRKRVRGSRMDGLTPEHIARLEEIRRLMPREDAGAETATGDAPSLRAAMRWAIDHVELPAKEA